METEKPTMLLIWRILFKLPRALTQVKVKPNTMISMILTWIV